MALHRSTCAAIYIFVSYAFGRCSAAKAVPTNGRPTQAVVGPDGVLAQAAASAASAAHEEQAQVMRRAEEQLPHTVAAAADPRMPAAALPAVAAVAVDPAGRSQPVARPAVAARPAGVALADAGVAAEQPGYVWSQQPPRFGRMQPQFGQPTWGQQSSTWGRAAANHPPPTVGSSVPVSVGSGAPVGSTAPTATAKMCDMPMWGGRPLWDKEKYTCEEYETYKSIQGYTWIDKAGNIRIRVPEAVKCTVVPVSLWMMASVDSMICQNGMWVAEGKQVTDIECSTAYWFIGLLVAFVLADLLFIYKLKFKKDSALYMWWHGTSKEPLLEDISGAQEEVSNVQDDQQQH